MCAVCAPIAHRTRYGPATASRRKVSPLANLFGARRSFADGALRRRGQNAAAWSPSESSGDPKRSCANSVRSRGESRQDLASAAMCVADTSSTRSGQPG